MPALTALHGCTDLSQRDLRRLHTRVYGTACIVVNAVGTGFGAVNAHEHRAFHAVDGDRGALKGDDGVDGIVIDDGVV